MISAIVVQSAVKQQRSSKHSEVGAAGDASSCSQRCNRPNVLSRVQVKGTTFTQQQRLARLELLCRTLAPQQKPADTLAALGVFDFYPYLAALMCGHQWGPNVQQAGAAYLSYVSLLNQVRSRTSSGRPARAHCSGAGRSSSGAHAHWHALVLEPYPAYHFANFASAPCHACRL